MKIQKFIDLKKKRSTYDIKNKKKLSKIMLVSIFVCALFYSLSYPYIYAEMIKVVSKNYISAEQIITCISIVVLGIIWNKKGNKLYKHYPLIVLLETIASIILFAHVLITGNYKFYFVFNILIYVFITRNIINGGIKLKAKVHPDEKSRETYDNNSNIVSSIATLLGASISIVISFDIKILFIFALIGNIFDNLCYYYIFKKVEGKEKNNE